MRRMAVLGFALFVVAGCGGGGGGSVEGMMPTGPQEPDVGAMEPVASPTLSTLGAYETTSIDNAGNDSTAVFYRWGIWGGILRDDMATCAAIGCPPPGDTIFMAYMNHEIDGSVGMATQGTRSGTSPGAGSAVWTGDVKAYETEDVMTSGGSSVTAYAPVEGSVRLAVDLAATTVDVDFTNFDNDRKDMSWDGLAMQDGEFGSRTLGMEGAFYGADHEGVAGTFARDGLTGVFGALRSSE